MFTDRKRRRERDKETKTHNKDFGAEKIPLVSLQWMTNNTMHSDASYFR